MITDKNFVLTALSADGLTDCRLKQKFAVV